VVLEVVIGLGVVNLTNALIVAVVIILWIIVGIYTANNLGLSIKFFLRRILQPHPDDLQVEVQLLDSDLISILRDKYAQFLAHEYAHCF
jgi:hypothetical protein